MTIDLKHLRVIRAIREHGTLSGAARELGYSQPAVSQQVRHIERMLGTPVLLRHTTGATLTEAGEVLARTGSPVLSQVSQALSEIEAIVGLRAGRVRVACFRSATAVLLPDALSSVRKEHPGLAFTLHERRTKEALGMLRDGSTDIAIVFEYSSDDEDERFQLLPGETRIQLAEESAYLAIPPEHPLANQRVVKLADFADEDWISGCPSCRTQLMKMCAAAGFVPNIAFETDDHVAIQALVGANLGVAMLTELISAVGNQEFPARLKSFSPISTRVVYAVTTEALLTVPGVGPIINALRVAGQKHVNSY